MKLGNYLKILQIAATASCFYITFVFNYSYSNALEKIASLSQKSLKQIHTKLTRFGNKFVDAFMSMTHWS